VITFDLLIIFVIILIIFDFSLNPYQSALPAILQLKNSPKMIILQEMIILQD
jgi:hypothetical protein